MPRTKFRFTAAWSAARSLQTEAMKNEAETELECGLADPEGPGSCHPRNGLRFALFCRQILPALPLVACVQGQVARVARLLLSNLLKNVIAAFFKRRLVFCDALLFRLASS